MMESLGYSPKRKSAIEYSSPCPYCNDGNDRFLLWPEKGECGRFWCRRCEERGDAINLLRTFMGMSYKEACKRLTVSVARQKKETNEHVYIAPAIISEDPPTKWSESAMSFVEECHIALMSDDIYLSALLKRGISAETIKKFKLGYNPSTRYIPRESWGLLAERNKKGGVKDIWAPSGVVIPTFEGGKVVKLKIRNSTFEKGLIDHETAKYVVVSGSKKSPSIFGERSLKALLVLESELDAILVCQEAGDLVFCLALGGSTQPLDLQKERIVRGSERLLFCPDFDEAGKTSWLRWNGMFPHIERILTEEGKDPTEDFQKGVNLKKWIHRHLYFDEECFDDKRDNISTYENERTVSLSLQKNTEWFLSNRSKFPLKPFQLKPSVFIENPQKFFYSLEVDILEWNKGHRFKQGALENDLEILREMFSFVEKD